MEITLESLGLTREDVLDRVVSVIADRLMASRVADEDGDEVTVPSSFARLMERRVLERTNAAVEEIAGRHVLPNVAAYVETLCLQETNKWGEKKGAPVTFVEYLVQRAEHYLREDVDLNGKAKPERDGYSWNKSTTRIAHMVHEHLKYSIQTAMEQALKTANAAIVGGIEQAVKLKLGEVLDSLKVTTKIGR